jgi:TolA-binding protein
MTHDLIRPAALSLLLILFRTASCSLFAPCSSASRDGTATIEAARDRFDHGEYAFATEMLRALLSQSPNDPQLHYWLGRCAYEQKDFEHASEHFHRAVELDTRVSIFHQWLGRAYSENAERSHSLSLARKSKSEYGTAVQLDPANLAARRDLEEYDIDSPWIAGGNKDDALTQADAIAARDPVEGHLARAYYFLHAVNQATRAEQEFLSILEAKPHRIAPYFEAARHFQHDDKPAQLEAFIQAAASVDPSDPRLDYFHGVLLALKKSGLEVAEGDLKKYISGTPDRNDWPSHADAMEWLGRTYELQGKKADATAQYRAALQLDPRLRRARESLRRLENASR